MLLTLAIFAGARAHAQELDHGDPELREQQALTVQGIAGEILDTAVEHCRRGESAQALSMFAAIREQLSPPPGILRVITNLESTGCRGSLIPTDVRGLRVQVGTGWDSNVSQGITARSLVIGSGDNAVELQLDETYRPRASAFVTAAVDYALPLGKTGFTARAGVAGRHNEKAMEFDLATGSGAISREFKLGDTSIRTQVEATHTWLGGRHFQTTAGASANWLGTAPWGAWLANAQTVKIDYPTQPTQNAYQSELGLLLERRIYPTLSVYGSAALQFDNSVGQRAGGDRRGGQVRAGALVVAAGWQWRPQLTYSTWDSEELFAPGLIDVKRRNRYTQFALQAERSIFEKTSIVLELNARAARDTIALYRYNAQSITATLAHRF